MTTLIKSLTGAAVAVVVTSATLAPASAAVWTSNSDTRLINKMIHALSPGKGSYNNKRYNYGWKPKQNYKQYDNYGRRKQYDRYSQRTGYKARNWRRGFAKRYGWNNKSWVLNSRRAGHVDLQVFFRVGSAQLSPRAYRILDSLGEALSYGSLRHSYFKIGGHTDASGSYESNRYLSQRRAAAVKRYLSRYHSIASRRLVAVGFGEERLAYPGQPYSKKNRRVEVSVISKAQAYRLRNRSYARY